MNLFVIFIILVVRLSESAKILVLHPIYCGSHEFVLRSLGDHLVSRGHQVSQVCRSVTRLSAICKKLIGFFFKGQVPTFEYSHEPQDQCDAFNIANH